MLDSVNSALSQEFPLLALPAKESNRNAARFVPAHAAFELGEQTRVSKSQSVQSGLIIS